jgi:hypothetical protein
MCLWCTRIEMSCILWFLGLSEVFFTSVLFSLFCPFMNFLSGLNCVCVDSLQGTWWTRGNLFSLVLTYSFDLNWRSCSFWNLRNWSITRRPSKIFDITSMVTPCMCDGPFRRLMSKGMIAWSKWVICSIFSMRPTNVARHGRLVLAFWLIRKMLCLGGRAYYASNFPLLALSNVKRRIESLW